MKKSKVIVSVLAAAMFSTSALGLVACSKDAGIPFGGGNEGGDGVYTITFDANGGTLTGAATRMTVDGRLTALPGAADVTYSGHDFDGWYTLRDGGTKVTTSTTFGGELTVYAHWTPSGGGGGGGDSSYTITFHANNGTDATQALTTDTSGYLTQNAPTFTYAGHSFNGWYDSATGGGLVSMTNSFTQQFTASMHVYAQWTSGGSVVTTGAGVNGNAMTNNPSPGYGAEEEHMIKGLQLATGTALSFTLNGSPVTISKLDGASTGLSFSGGTVSVSNGGTFDLYLKKMESGWEVYGSRAIVAGEATIHGEDATDGNVYLAGNISGADFSWANWNGADYSSGEHKGLKASGSGSSFTLTVTLSVGDNCKFVMYSNPMKWQEGGVSGTGAGYIDTESDSNGNMVISAQGTYTFTITVDGENLSVSVTYAG